MAKKKSKSQRRKEGKKPGATVSDVGASEIIERLDKIASNITKLSEHQPSPPPAVLQIPPPKNRRKIPRFASGAVSILGVVGFGIAIYQIRPLPIPQSGTSIESSKGVRNSFAILNSGHLPMRNVDVSCDFTKVVFDGKHTLITGDGYKASMYRVPDVAPGERFTVRCPQSWRLFIAKDRTFALVTIGEPQSQPPGNTARLGSTENPHLYLSIARLALLPYGGIGPLKSAASDETLRNLSDPIESISGMDLTITIKYYAGLPFADASLSFILLSRQMRFVASVSEGRILWRPVPIREPGIPNGTGELITLEGLKLEVTNNVPGAPPPPQ